MIRVSTIDKPRKKKNPWKQHNATRRVSSFVNNEVGRIARNTRRRREIHFTEKVYKDLLNYILDMNFSKSRDTKSFSMVELY